VKKAPKIALPAAYNTDAQQLEYQSINTLPYSSSDLNFVAFLKVCYGLKVVSVSRDAQGRVQWGVNLGDLRLNELFDAYVGSASLSCAAFVAEQRNLKNQIHTM
jgi:hypothetical protein